MHKNIISNQIKKALIMTSRDGYKFKITIDNTGRLVPERIN